MFWIEQEWISRQFDLPVQAQVLAGSVLLFRAERFFDFSIDIATYTCAIDTRQETQYQIRRSQRSQTCNATACLLPVTAGPACTVISSLCALVKGSS